MKISDEFIKKYNSVIQTNAMLADTQNLIGELGRGTGKTTELLAPRLMRVSYGMPRSILALAGPSYAFVLDTIVSGILTFMNKHYERGKHFEYGKEPPKWFKRPYTEVTSWKHTISFPWGTVTKFAGIDRPNTSGVGQNFAHVFIDELLRISETNFTERLLPAQRGDRQIFGKSPYFGGITGFSSTPNFENDHDWWLDWQSNMDKGLIEEIMYVALKVSQAMATAEQWKIEKTGFEKKSDWDAIKTIDPKIDQKLRFAARWEKKLMVKRKGQTYYMKGSSFTNLAILGLDYMKNQFKGTSNNIDKFKLSILGIRPSRVKNLFLAKFDKKNIYEDSYKYDAIDMYDVDGNFKRTSRDLKYCDTNKPILMGLDPGNFMSCVFAQEFSEGRQKVMRVFKNMYVISPNEHFELAQNINNYFLYQRRKVIYMHYDRAGNQRKEKYSSNKKGDTDAKILKSELEALGWTIHLMSMDQRTIFYWQHYMLFSRLLSEREKQVPILRLCQNECEELISSIYMSPLKRTKDGSIVLDKSSEVKLEYEDQAWYSTQIPSALMYLVFGKYEKWMPTNNNKLPDIEGM